MDKTLFFDSVIEELKNQNVVFDVTKAEKNGVIKTAISVKKDQDASFGANVYLEDMYERDLSVEAAVSTIIELTNKALDVKPDFVTDLLLIFSDTDEVLKRVRVYVAKEGSYMDCVRKEENGITKVLTVILGDNAEGVANAKIKKAMLDKWDISEDDLWKQAEFNSENHVVIKGMGEILAAQIGADNAEFLDVFRKEDEQMFVVSNENNCHGAYGAFTKTAKDFIKDTFGTDKYYVLPSSVHECIIIPNTAQMLAKQSDEEILKILGSMVRDVNASTVSEEDQLSDTPLLVTI